MSDAAGARRASRVAGDGRREPFTEPTATSMKAQPAVIVLAAGRGSRFLGTDHKLAQRLGTATVLAMTLRHAIASTLQVVVVTTARFADQARLNVAARDVVVLPEPGENAVLGMGYSIAAGVGARP